MYAENSCFCWVIKKLIFLLTIHKHPERTTLILNISLVPILWSNTFQAINKCFLKEYVNEMTYWFLNPCLIIWNIFGSEARRNGLPNYYRCVHIPFLFNYIFCFLLHPLSLHFRLHVPVCQLPYLEELHWFRVSLSVVTNKSGVSVP